ncbi:MAG: DNA metabolism protein, partial [Lachnospiraceae bacterium]|nr:DNA metabolism protein [Lachnospiraceae bacterium]
MDSIVLICEDSIEGIFTAVYESYCMKLEHENSRIQIGEEGNLRLFSTYHTIIPDQEKAVRVIKTLITRFGQEVYYTLCQALSTEDADKGDAVYH